MDGWLLNKQVYEQLLAAGIPSNNPITCESILRLLSIK